jgi:inositol phosphorylceramide mannosyltransferase catalytic subunit
MFRSRELWLRPAFVPRTAPAMQATSITASARPSVPIFPMGDRLPRVIHQTFATKTLPPSLAANVAQLQRTNPGWTHKLYDDADVRKFISDHYGSAILSYYDRISPNYMAGKMDLFRYLLVYKEGGIYLDIKSSFSRPIEDQISLSDQFILAKWHNADGLKHGGFGLHKELQHLPGGEFQQWHIIAVPGHPYLRHVIEQIFVNIDTYRPWRNGVGQMGSLRLVGPIVYTLTIDKIQHDYPHRVVDPDAVGLEYSVMQGDKHKGLFKKHYVSQTGSLVIMHGWKRHAGSAYSAILSGWQLATNGLRRTARRFGAKKVLNLVRSGGAA